MGDESAVGEEAISDRDRALFEAGIKLGALYHQFTGTPVSTETVEELETTIERSVSLQPWVNFVEVRIDREKVHSCETDNHFNYCELRGEMLNVKVVVRYGNEEVHARVSYEAALDYPLMRVEKIYKKSSCVFVP
jgi:Uncharacterized protein conserved in archaea